MAERCECEAGLDRRPSRALVIARRRLLTTPECTRTGAVPSTSQQFTRFVVNMIHYHQKSDVFFQPHHVVNGETEEYISEQQVFPTILLVPHAWTAFRTFYAHWFVSFSYHYFFLVSDPVWQTNWLSISFFLIAR